MTQPILTWTGCVKWVSVWDEDVTTQFGLYGRKRGASQPRLDVGSQKLPLDWLACSQHALSCLICQGVQDQSGGHRFWSPHLVSFPSSNFACFLDVPWWCIVDGFSALMCIATLMCITTTSSASFISKCSKYNTIHVEEFEMQCHFWRRSCTDSLWCSVNDCSQEIFAVAFSMSARRCCFVKSRSPLGVSFPSRYRSEFRWRPHMRHRTRKSVREDWHHRSSSVASGLLWTSGRGPRSRDRNFPTM